MYGDTTDTEKKEGISSEGPDELQLLFNLMILTGQPNIAVREGLSAKVCPMEASQCDSGGYKGP